MKDKHFTITTKDLERSGANKMIKSKQKVAILAIDPQYDFHDIPDESKVISGLSNDGTIIKVEPALPVPGSWEDANRLAAFIRKFSNNINKINVTLDTHQRFDIAHELYWTNSKGERPTPFTLITNQNIKDRTWFPVYEAMYQHVLDYTEALEEEGKYTLIIWPTHCLVGEPGHNIVEPVRSAIAEWETSRCTRYMPLSKGHNPQTEHYGGCEAEYPMPNDPTTRLNKNFISSIEDNDLVIITGQALSHCVASTVRQIIDNFDESNIKKLVLLEDTSSPVSGFEQQAKDFVKDMTAKGMRTAKTSDFQIKNGELTF